MKTLLVIRHAKSSWKNETLFDIERSLNTEGHKEVEKLAAWLEENKLIPQKIYCSSAARTYQTILGVSYRNKWLLEILELKSSLYESTLTNYIKEISKTPNDINTLMIVGHNPVVSELTGYISGQTTDMKTGNASVLSLNIKSWIEVRENCGTLLDYYNPL